MQMAVIPSITVARKSAVKIKGVASSHTATFPVVVVTHFINLLCGDSGLLTKMKNLILLSKSQFLILDSYENFIG